MGHGRGVRGTALEKLLEYTNMRYLELGLCRVDKIATPVKVIELEKGVIRRGFYEKPSIVDFVGIIQGAFVAYDAKETQGASLPLNNIHAHQVKYMKDVDSQGGVSFLVVHFKKQDKYFLVPLNVLLKYYEDDSVKSIPYSAMKECVEIELAEDGTLRYIDALNEIV